MTQRLYRVMVLSGGVTWLLVGMYLCRVLAAVDAGVTPAMMDRLLLAGWGLVSVLDTVALLRLPIPSRNTGSSAPAA